MSFTRMPMPTATATADRRPALFLSFQKHFDLKTAQVQVQGYKDFLSALYFFYIFFYNDGTYSVEKNFVVKLLMSAILYLLA